MFWADTEGPAKILEGLKRQQDRLGDDFSLSDLLVKKAKPGRNSRADRQRPKRDQGRCHKQSDDHDQLGV
jgi:hypothetical protein